MSNYNMVVGSDEIEVIPEIVNIAPYTPETYWKENKIVKFLNREIAEKTRAGYERTIKDFFQVDDVRYISVYDVLNVDIDDAEKYRDDMINRLNRGSVATYIKHMKALYDFLIIQCTNNKLGIKLLQGNPFDIDVRLTGKMVPIESRPQMYGSYSQEEVSDLIKVALPEMKLLYEIATRCAIRKESILQLNFNRDMIWYKGKWNIKIDWDKTMPVEVAITNEMHRLAEEFADQDGKIFHMSQATVNNRLRQDSLKIGISEEDIKRRKLTVHSLKKAAGVMTKHATNGNLLIMKDTLHHTSTVLADTVYSLEEHNPNTDMGIKFNITDFNCDKEFESEISRMENWELRDLLRGLDYDIKKGLLEGIVRSKAGNRQVM